MIPDTDHKETKIGRMREAIRLMKKVKNCYLDAQMHVEALSQQTMIDIRQTQLDYFIAQEFPITEKRKAS